MSMTAAMAITATDRAIRLPARDLLHQLHLWLDERGLYLPETLAVDQETARRSWERAKSSGHVSLVTAEHWCELIGIHPRRVWGELYDAVTLLACSEETLYQVAAEDPDDINPAPTMRRYQLVLDPTTIRDTVRLRTAVARLGWASVAPRLVDQRFVMVIVAPLTHAGEVLTALVRALPPELVPSIHNPPDHRITARTLHQALVQRRADKRREQKQAQDLRRLAMATRA